MSEAKQYLVYSRYHNAFWGPDNCGYTNLIDEAGRYTKADAEANCIKRSPNLFNGPQEVVVPAPEAIDQLTTDYERARSEWFTTENELLVAKDELATVKAAKVELQDALVAAERAMKTAPYTEDIRLALAVARATLSTSAEDVR